MSGIYIHIPFCKQACHYCDFHFSTSLGKKEEMIGAIEKELKLRKAELLTKVETIYFGGGTPSILKGEEINAIIDTVYSEYEVIDDPEITLEANPDDLDLETIKVLAGSRVNRLSIGIQSFLEADLKLMNRAHNAKEAKDCLDQAKKYFDNISIDLIYGIPNMTNEQWQENLDVAIALNIPHISSYALTVEPKTALHSFIEKGVIDPVDDEAAQQHFNMLIDTMEEKGYEHYETSNFAKPGYFSKNNSAYWQNKPYLGVGPSAHSFDREQRSWNINNNAKYIKALAKDELPIERERLSAIDRYNEYVMTGLRTIWGVSLSKVEKEYGQRFRDYLLKQSKRYVDEHLLYIDDDKLMTSKNGRFLSDGIAADLFMVDFAK
ncbi:radical SAM family heme chaperone HemW [Spongiivirga citrea]|uniref:Heme chaperone HemW n=1 Tax=Spongiivirga citrea TaxID=1481457 RepID=A0A6M0CJM6_9FLAO|nr:radical SAM family heme chaperone HemW [Spongiivirga citrea]NER18148.1 radical SAM family heme chaperone HemW [Spongiivirga citrea]